MRERAHTAKPLGIVLKHDRVALDAAPTLAAGGRAGRARACATRRAELVRVDGVPVAVEVTCSCGETTLVEFVDAAPDPATSSPATDAPPASSNTEHSD